MKLSKDELLSKINEKVMDEDVKIELLEDITDSFEIEGTTDDSVYTEKIAELEEKLKNITEKYKDRFLKGDEKAEEEPEELEEPEEKEIVDIKEI